MAFLVFPELKINPGLVNLLVVFLVHLSAQ